MESDASSDGAPEGARASDTPVRGPERRESRSLAEGIFAVPVMGAFEHTPDVGDEVGITSEWSVPWSDLMMVMFMLFVVLFTYQAAEREVESAFRPDDTARMASALPPPLPDETYRLSLDAVRLADLEDVEVVLREDRSVKVSVHGPLLFSLGEAELLPDTQSFLDRLAAVVARTRGGVEVTGHTDNFPIHGARYPTNWELSAARAASVARHLIRNGPADPARFTIAGRSMYAPTVPNDSPANKALNRRVEIVFARSDPPTLEDLP